MDRNAGKKSQTDDLTEDNGNRSKFRKFLKRECKDIASSNFWRAVLAEFLGTYILCFWTIGMSRYDPENASPTDLLLVAVGTGFTVACLINALVNVSGGHVNPALSLAFLLRGEITCLKFVFCVISQCLASVCAVLTLSQLVPESMHGDFGLLLPRPGITIAQALVAEFWITFGLLFVINAFIDDKRPDVTNPVPIYVGMIVAANILFADRISGGCMSPARNFCPAYITGNFRHQWIYWVGPLGGASVGTLMYNKLLSAAAMTESFLRPCIRGRSRDNNGQEIENEREHNADYRGIEMTVGCRPTLENAR